MHSEDPDQLVVLEVPVESLRVQYRISITDPLTHARTALESFTGMLTQPASRLAGMTRVYSQSGRRREFEVEEIVFRDLVSGECWNSRDLDESELQVEKGSSRHRVDVVVQPFTEAVNTSSADLITPVSHILSKISGIPRRDVVPHTTISSVESIGSDRVALLPIKRVKDSMENLRWVPYSRSMQELSSRIIQTTETLRPKLADSSTTRRQWPLAPEVAALRELRSASRGQKVEVAKRIANSLLVNLENDDRPRLNRAIPVVGSCLDMWHAAGRVIDSAREHVIMLTSFTNLAQLNAVKDRIEYFSPSGRKTSLSISIGEPDRVSNPASMNRSMEFAKSLEGLTIDDVAISYGISPIPTHSKIMISDAGVAFITSCNLLSSSQEHFQLESGLLIEDSEFCSVLINHVNEEGWIPEEMAKTVQRMSSHLSSIEFTDHTFDYIKKKIRKTAKKLESKSSSRYGIIALDNQLQKIAERPVWTLVSTLEHRALLEDSIEQFSERLVLASDGLRSTGLDKSLVNRIGRRVEALGKSSKNPTVQVWWGRQNPESRAKDKNEKRVRLEASRRLEQLRSKSNKLFSFYPSNSNEPMGTHAKLLVVDDMRLVVTSDNMLAFGSEERALGDAGELGIMIDHPRIARQMRGNMELWLPEGRSDRDITRWGALIAEEITEFTHNQHTIVQLDKVLSSAVERVSNIPELSQDWSRTFKRKEPDNIVQDILDQSWNNGGLVGIFHAQGPGASRFRSVESSTTSVTLAGNPIWREHTLFEKSLWDDVLIEAGFFSKAKHSREACEKCGKPECSNGPSCSFNRRGRCRFCHCSS